MCQFINNFAIDTSFSKHTYNNNINVVKFTVGPTVSLVAAYLMAMERDALAPPMPIEAIQIRPESN